MKARWAKLGDAKKRQEWRQRQHLARDASSTRSGEEGASKRVPVRRLRSQALRGFTEFLSCTNRALNKNGDIPQIRVFAIRRFGPLSCLVEFQRSAPKAIPFARCETGTVRLPLPA